MLDSQITYILNTEEHEADASLENLNFKVTRPDMKIHDYFSRGLYLISVAEHRRVCVCHWESATTGRASCLSSCSIRNTNRKTQTAVFLKPLPSPALDRVSGWQDGYGELYRAFSELLVMDRIRKPRHIFCSEAAQVSSARLQTL